MFEHRAVAIGEFKQRYRVKIAFLGSALQMTSLCDFVESAMSYLLPLFIDTFLSDILTTNVVRHLSYCNDSRVEQPRCKLDTLTVT